MADLSDWRARLAKVPLWVWALSLSLVTLLPRLGTYGLWDAEFPLAETARSIAEGTASWGSVFHAKPPLTIWLVALGVKIFGVSEIAGRLPLAFMGIAGAMATYGIGARLRSPRAGLFAAMVLLASPLWIFQSRQITSDIGGAAGAAIAVYGMIGLVWPRDDKAVWWRLPLDALGALVGLTLGFLQSGLLAGVLLPVSGVAIATVIAAAFRFETGSRPRLLTAAAVSGGAALVGLAIVLFAYGTKTYSTIFGGTWRPDPLPTATYSWVVDQVAVGMFPWSALAPLAVLRLAMVKKPDRRAWAGILVLSWAVVGYGVATFFNRKLVGDLRFPALAAIAVAVGFLLDELLIARASTADDPDDDAAPIRSGLPLVALFVFCAAAQLGLDDLRFPDELASIHVLTTTTYPKEVKLLPFLVVIGLAFGGLAAIGVLVPRKENAGPVHRLAQDSLWGAIAVASMFGLFLSCVYTPKLSQHFSYKNLFDSYRAHKKNGEKLGVSGITGPGPDYYAHGTYDKLAGQPAIFSFLQSTDRVFAISPVSDLCALHQKAGLGTFEFHVIDNRNSRFLLYSNKLADGEKDRDPLLTSISRTPPENIATPMQAVFVPAVAGQKGRIELIGYDMPEHVAHGGKFTMKMYFHIAESVTSNYRSFMHFDNKSSRFQGDHEPIDGRCGTGTWQQGDYITDTVTVTAGELTTPSGKYELWMGFYQSPTAGQYTNMKVESASTDHDAANRVHLGSIIVGSESGGGGCQISLGR
jgi:4-amino-4-deoxy-L-arabinose transferase-like glycosyltransferase